MEKSPQTSGIRSVVECGSGVAVEGGCFSDTVRIYVNNRRCHRLNVYVPQNLYIEILTPSQKWVRWMLEREITIIQRGTKVQ